MIGIPVLGVNVSVAFLCLCVSVCDWHSCVYVCQCVSVIPVLGVSVCEWHSCVYVCQCVSGIPVFWCVSV